MLYFEKKKQTLLSPDAPLQTKADSGNWIADQGRFYLGSAPLALQDGDYPLEKYGFPARPSVKEIGQGAPGGIARRTTGAARRMRRRDENRSRARPGSGVFE